MTDKQHTAIMLTYKRARNYLLQSGGNPEAAKNKARADLAQGRESEDVKTTTAALVCTAIDVLWLSASTMEGGVIT